MKKKINKGVTIFFITIFCFGLFSCKKGKDRPAPAPPVKVKVMSVGDEQEEIYKTYSGTVKSAVTTTVSFSVAGTITALYAREGMKVSKGELLGKLRAGEYENAYNIAQAQLAEAQDGYNRLKKLHDADALPEVKWVEMEQKLKQAQNAAEMAKRTLDDANLHSPVAGTVTQKFADVGQTVMPVQPVYEIVSVNDLEVEISVQESEIGNFKQGDKAKVLFKSLDNLELSGKVTQKAVVADPLTLSYPIKISLPNPDGKLLPGMIADVTFEDLNTVDSETAGIVLPTQAVLLNHDNRWFVWVVTDSVAERRFVEADELVTQGILVKNGLVKGEKVIVEGMQKVGSGTKVVY